MFKDLENEMKLLKSFNNLFIQFIKHSGFHLILCYEDSQKNLPIILAFKTKETFINILNTDIETNFAQGTDDIGQNFSIYKKDWMLWH